jgi:hypothetical protein
MSSRRNRWSRRIIVLVLLVLVLLVFFLLWVTLA